MRSKVRFLLKFAIIASQLFLIWFCAANLYHELLAKAIPILTGDQGIIQGVTWKAIFYSSSKGQFYIIPVGYYTFGMVLFLSLALSSMGWRFARQLHKLGLGIGILMLSHLAVLGYEVAIPSKSVLASLNISLLPRFLIQSLISVAVPIALWYSLILRRVRKVGQ